MTIDPNTLAAGNYVGVKNVQFAVGASVLERKILIIGTKDPAKTTLAVDTPVQVFSASDVADKAGFGSMLHRLAERSFEGSQGVETWMVPQDEAGGAVAAAGEIDWTGSTGVKAGTLAIYIAGLRVAVNITDAMTIEEISDAVVAAITADTSLPVTASKVAVTFETTITAKTKGPWGNDIDISLNLQVGDETPTGITTVITDMSGGSGLPDITTALDAIGTTGTDGQNGDFYTDVIHGYGQDTTTLDAISNYNGAGNTFVGNYKKEVARPFRSLVGDTAAGSAGLTALIAVGDGRKLDRTSGILAAPGSQNHPEELAAFAVGTAARINSTRAEETTIDQSMAQFRPGDVADRWTDDSTNRDLAIKAGISTTQVKGGNLTIQNLVTFYHPDSVSQSSNGYRSYRNISVLQNIMNAHRLNFEQEKWKGITIVNDTSAVSNPTSRAKARDTGSVIDDLVALAYAYAENAWIYDAGFTIGKLQEGGAVSIRAGVTGFDITVKVILSGEGGIFNTDIEFDISIAALL